MTDALDFTVDRERRSHARPQSDTDGATSCRRSLIEFAGQEGGCVIQKVDAGRINLQAASQPLSQIGSVKLLVLVPHVTDATVAVKRIEDGHSHSRQRD